MDKIKKIFALVIMLSCLFSFNSLAKEGMATVRGDDNSAVLAFINEDGTYAINQWKQAWENWYYFDEDGYSKQNTWAEIDSKWYYFDEWSRMLHDTTTPDGYYVGSDGAWVE